MGKGSFEQPGSGALLDIETMGVYMCRTCNAPLFNSQDKLQGADDYATFRSPIQDEAIVSARSYSLHGDEESIVRCAQCKAEVGYIDNFVLRSADDLEQGAAELEYKVSSNAVRFKRSRHISQYPLGYLVVVLLLIVSAFVSWHVFNSFQDRGFITSGDTKIQLWVGEREVRATPVVLAEAVAEGSIPSIESGTLLLVVPPDTMALRVRIANHPFEVLWLDDQFRTISHETIDPAKSDEFIPPLTSRYALVMLPGNIPAVAQQAGYEVIVINKADLL